MTTSLISCTFLSVLSVLFVPLDIMLAHVPFDTYATACVT